jgi:hypothetical protein
MIKYNLIILILILSACSGPLCDNKDRLEPWAHIEHWPDTSVEEPAPVAGVQEAVEQIGCRLGI